MPFSESYNPRLLQSGAFPFAELFERKRELLRGGSTIYDFSIGDPVEPTPQFIRERLRGSVPERSRYPTPEGSAQLRRAAADYLERRFGASLNPDTQILPTLGSKEAVFNTAFLFGGGSSKNVMLGPAPGYFVVERSARMNGMEFCALELTPANRCLVELSELPEELLKHCALAWINYPHNPTGASCSLDYLKRQAAAAQRYGFLLCSDETYADIYFGEPPPSVLQAADRGVLAYHSCSKRSGMTGYRSGFIAGDPSVIERFRDYRNTIGTAGQEFVQLAAAAAWSDDEHAAARRNLFRDKRAVMLPLFDELGFEVWSTDASFYLWVDCGMDSSLYAAELLEAGIAVSPGICFGEKSPGWFRVALAPSPADCRKAAELWAAHSSRS